MRAQFHPTIYGTTVVSLYSTGMGVQLHARWVGEHTYQVRIDDSAVGRPICVPRTSTCAGDCGGWYDRIAHRERKQRGGNVAIVVTTVNGWKEPDSRGLEVKV